VTSNQDTSTRDGYLLVVVEESESRVGFYDSLSGERVGSVEVGFLPHEIDISADRKTAYVSNFGLQDYDETLGVAGYSISILDLELMCERGRLYTVLGDAGLDATRSGRAVPTSSEVFKGPHGVKLRPGRNELFVNVEQGGRILVFDLETQAVKRALTPAAARVADPNWHNSYADPKGTHHFVFNADGSALYLFAGPQGVYKMDPDTGKLTAHYEPRTAMRGLGFLPDGRSLIAAGVNELVLLDPADLSEQKIFGGLGVGQLLYPVAAPDGERIIVAACWDSQVLVVDARSGRVLERIVTGIDPVHSLIAPGGDAVWISNARSRYLTRIDLTTYRKTRLETGEGPNGILACPRYAKRLRKPIVFGCVLPLSGALGQSGRELAAGYQYWTERVNAAGGLAVADEVYEVALALRDNASDATRTAGLTTELLDEAGAAYMFGGYPTPSDQAAEAVVNARGVPLVTSACAGAGTYHAGNRFVFGVLSPAGGSFMGTIDVVTALTPAPETFCMLSSDDPAAHEDALINAAYAKARGLRIIFPPDPLPEGISVTQEGVIVYREGTADFTPILRLLSARLLSETGPTMFFKTGHAPATLAVIEQAAEVGFAPAGLGFAAGLGTPTLVHAAGALAANVFGSTQWSSELTSLGFDRFGTAGLFASDYYQRYNMEASYLSAGAVACGLTFEDAIQRAGTIDRATVREALAATHLATFYGLIQFNARGINESKPLLTIQLQQQGGRLVNAVLAPSEPAGSAKAVWPFPGWPPGAK
jgi:ABC-type branched-subunit amino acid transport system substrate-binding protein